MEHSIVPSTISFEALLLVLNQKPLDPTDQYRNVYIIQMIQHLQLLILQDRRRSTRS